MGIIGVTVLSALSLVGVGSSAQALPGTPGTPQSGSIVYAEDFENGATSPTYIVASPPSSRISWTARERSTGSRELRTTRAPRDAASFAVASPIPLDAPVITIT
jgi:hypothetical protein